MYWQAPDAMDVLLEELRVVDVLTPVASAIAGAGAVDRVDQPDAPRPSVFVAWLERRQSAASPRPSKEAPRRAGGSHAGCD